MATANRLNANPLALREVQVASAKGLETDMLDVMVELAKRAPPLGSPVDTGNNRNSIKWKKTAQLIWHVITETGYGAWLELGTARMAARPYFAPAFKEANAEFQGKGPFA